MIKITDGINVFEVTSGAYNKIYKAQGFTPVVGKSQVLTKVVNNDKVVASDELDPYAELLEKPLSQWSKTEVKTFAEAKSISLAGTKNVNEAKAIIKKFLASEKE